MSDQDFFFDEDEAPAKEAAPKKTASDKPARSAKQADVVAPSGAQSVTMGVASLIGVIALLAGVIIGIVIPVGNGTATAPTATQTTTTSSAPQLSPEQLEGGALPEGHPDIGSMGGSTETTGN